MDGFAESEKSESETGFGFVKSNTALVRFLRSSLSVDAVDTIYVTTKPRPSSRDDDCVSVIHPAGAAGTARVRRLLFIRVSDL